MHTLYEPLGTLVRSEKLKGARRANKPMYSEEGGGGGTMTIRSARGVQPLRDSRSA